VCALCGEPLPRGDARCGACGYAVDRRFSRAAIAALCTLLVAVYAVTLLVVALAR
jgi:predicted nucleic acid-binding Zn ribbon protein